MGGYLFFPREEYEGRLAKVRRGMEERGLDACLFTSPENIYYLIGLDYQGYFGPHVLIVPGAGEMVLVARAMEIVTITAQVANAGFAGYADTANPGTAACREILEAGLGSARIGLQKQSLYFPPYVAETLATGLPDVRWADASGLVEDLRLVKSPHELDYTRRAAAVADAMVQAAIETAGVGVNEQEIAAAVHHAMILAGGEPAGFGPFIRSTARLGQEHSTWSDYVLRQGDVLFLEMAGCVGRYHAPMGRLLFIGEAPDGVAEVAALSIEAQQAVVDALRPGVTGAEVYGAWQERVDRAGLSHYRRHHCGYAVGVGFPPTWTGGAGVTSLHHESGMEIRPGMVFHQLSWLLDCGRGDYFVSDTALVTQDGCELLTTASRHVQVL
jgi:Xaa-Pro dipeptidase